MFSGAIHDAFLYPSLGMFYAILMTKLISSLYTSFDDRIK